LYQPIRTCLLSLLLLGASCLHASAETTRDEYTLATVNGEAITNADLDALIMETHRTAGARQMQDLNLRKLLDKAINDRLILQEARALGLDEDEEVLEPVAEKRAQNAVRAYVDAEFDPPDSVSDEAIQDYFEKYYWTIGLRQLSVRTREEAEDLADFIAGGASMDSLAGEVSLETHRYQGGLHKVKYWADIENVLREQARSLEVGQLSEPFAFREAFSLLRVEERNPVDHEAFSKYEPKIRRDLLAFAKEDAWEEFVRSLLDESPVHVDRTALTAIERDSSAVLRGEFLKESDRPALSIDPAHFINETALRKAISHGAMTNATAPFDTLLQNSIEGESGRLALVYHAERSGYLDSTRVVRQYERDIENALVEACLAEVIVPDIVFRRSEFEEFYKEHLDDFRGPDQVRLEMITMESEEVAKEIDARSQGGADFDFLKREYETALSHSGDSEWAAIEVFSAPIQEQLTRLQVGETSRPIELPTGWMVFRLEDRKRGEPLSIEEVDGQIRQVMFQRKFNELLDRYLELARERSEIVLDENQIDRYLGSD
jgi:parvulin-like peptidyl-prolyl isomerase